MEAPLFSFYLVLHSVFNLARLSFFLGYLNQLTFIYVLCILHVNGKFYGFEFWMKTSNWYFALEHDRHSKNLQTRRETNAYADFDLMFSEISLAVD